MKFLIVSLLLIVSCRSNKTALIHSDGTSDVYGCKGACVDTIPSYSTYEFQLDTLDYDRILFKRNFPDTVILIDTIVKQMDVQPEILCTFDDYETMKIMWVQDGWKLGRKVEAGTLFRNKSCVAAVKEK